MPDAETAKFPPGVAGSDRFDDGFGRIADRQGARVERRGNERVIAQEDEMADVT